MLKKGYCRAAVLLSELSSWPKAVRCTQRAESHSVQYQRYSHGAGLADRIKVSQLTKRLVFPVLLVSGSSPPVPKASSPDSGPVTYLTGTWIRDNSASDLAAYDRMLALLQLSGLQRTTALSLIEGVELQESEEGFTVQFLTVVPFFKVKEEVNFGAQTSQSRRDLRPGTQVARAVRVADGVFIKMTWDEPLAGSLAETYSVKGDVLYVKSEATIRGETERTTMVYRRSNIWRPKFSFPTGFRLPGQ